MPSSACKVYKCSNISSENIVINLDEVSAKGYRMPLFEEVSMGDSDSDEDMELSKYIVAALIHTE